MSGVAQVPAAVSVEEYLEGERRSEIRHEYVAGRVYAMAGASDDHTASFPHSRSMSSSPRIEGR
jgi:hypothetical protein